MKPSAAAGAWILFGLSVFLWGILTVFESALVGMSLQREKLLTFLLLVLPATAGAGLGLTSLIRKEGSLWLAATVLALNTIFALFHAMILAFAG